MGAAGEVGTAVGGTVVVTDVYEVSKPRPTTTPAAVGSGESEDSPAWLIPTLASVGSILADILNLGPIYMILYKKSIYVHIWTRILNK